MRKPAASCASRNGRRNESSSQQVVSMIVAPHTAEVTVEHYLRGVRIDSFLIKHFRNYTSWRMQRIVRAGQVTINGRVAELADRVRTGQNVSVRLIEPPDKLLTPERIPLEIVFEDEWLLVINKQPDVIVHPTGDVHSGTLANMVQAYLDAQTPVRGLLRPGLVHRLDRDTSGTIAVTKEHLSHRLLSIEFQQERVAKNYLALVEGVIRQDAGQLDYRIGRVNHPRCALMSARADSRNPKAARTLYEVVERFPEHTLVRCKPRTGRLHQIRVHLATLGHPIVGDEFYGAGGAIKSPRALEVRSLDDVETAALPPVSDLIGRQALHAEKLAFAHPILRDWREFEAPLPDDMRRAISRVSSLNV